MAKVKMLQHAASADTRIPYYKDDVAEVSDLEAIRFVSNGYAEYVDDDAEVDEVVSAQAPAGATPEVNAEANLEAPEA